MARRGGGLAEGPVRVAGSRHSLSGNVGDRVKEPVAAECERVENHFRLASGSDEAGGAEQPGMVRDELVRAFAYPGEVADAQLTAVAQRECDREPRWVAQRFGRLGGALELGQWAAGVPECLRTREVQAQQFAVILAHWKF